MKQKRFPGRFGAAVFAVFGAIWLVFPAGVLAQAVPGTAGGATRGEGGGGRDYRGEPTRLLEAGELPPDVKRLTDRICDPETLESSVYAGVFQYRCLGPQPAGLASPPGEPPTPRAKIHIDCDEKDGKPVNCIYHCGADEKSDCSGFISACVDNDGTVEGNSGSAKCFP